MNLNRDRFFILGGIISLSFFALIIVIIGWKVLAVSKPETFAMRKSDTITISLSSSPTKAQELVSKPSPLPEAEVQPVVEKIPEKAVEKTSDKVVEKASKKPDVKPEEKVVEPSMSDLFSTVKPNKVVPKVKDDGKRLAELNALESKVLTAKRDSKLFEKAKTLDLAKTGVKLSAVSGSSGPMVNEYKGKIQGIIYANFHPQSGTEGFSARVRLTLSPEGKLLSYKVISYSGSGVFNAEVDWLKERLGRIVLPSNPNGDEAVFEIILIAKD